MSALRPLLLVASALIAGSASARAADQAPSPGTPTGAVALSGLAPKASPPAAVSYERDIKPILVRHCYECHGEGGSRGDVTLDGHATLELLRQDTKLWDRVVDNVRSDLMPPPKQPRLSADERSKLVNWVRHDVQGVDCRAPDPGRVTVRRLNRREYNHSIQDLFGIDIEPSEDFPADDTGYGFDNIGDVLSMSPLLMEKYFAAADRVVSRVVASKPSVPRRVLGRDDVRVVSDSAEGVNIREVRLRTSRAGMHRIHITLSLFSFNPFKGSLKVTASVDGRSLLNKRLVAGNRNYKYTMDVPFGVGEHVLLLTVDSTGASSLRNLRVIPEELALEGPLGTTEWPAAHRRVFFKDEVPKAPDARQAYARDILERAATSAFRRPVDGKTLDGLVALASGAEKSTGRFEGGIAHALQAILVSPRFLFRIEGQTAPDDPRVVQALDQHNLAIRLSSLLWQGPPDAELRSLAAAGKLTGELPKQAKRMLADRRSERFFSGFVGQWLRSNDIESIPFNGGRFGALNPPLRAHMRAETETFLSYIMREDRDMMETITASYTFLNEALANHYGIMGVEGARLRRVELPKDDIRGGVLTQGTFLAVTSNPSRTSPVKRGLFVLDNLLGAPPPPPPAMIPNLEDAAAKDGKKPKTVREQLAIHRENPACASCHERMDPLGLAFENFDAIGRWRDIEDGKPIEAAGKLSTGETFTSVRDLRQVIGRRREPFYRNVVGKFFTFALGRGLEPADDCAVEAITARMMAGGGKFSTMLNGLLESAAFRQRRGDGRRGGVAMIGAKTGAKPVGKTVGTETAR
jgi:mono/diheme cytochrome c family protein